MKKFIIGIVFVLQISAVAGNSKQTATIASFNAQRLGNYQKDYTMMAEALTNFDVIGVVEVMNITGLENLVDALSKNSSQKWGYLISERSAGSARYSEFYAFVWKTPQVKLVKSYGFYKEDKDSDFKREPYAALFKTGNFDFIFVVCHIIWGEDPSKRCEEVELLPKVYSYFKILSKTENDIFIAGDFNIQPDSKCWNTLLNNPDEIKGLITITTKTTLGSQGFVSSYDNIFYSSKYTKGVVKSGALDIKKLFNIPLMLQTYKKNISDHIPVYVEVKTN